MSILHIFSIGLATFSLLSDESIHSGYKLSVVYIDVLDIFSKFVS